MSKRNLLIVLVVAVALLTTTGIPTKSNPGPDDLFADRNVNMVTDDPYLQRQNEPSLAVSTLNPRHLLAGANDYSRVDFKGDEVDVTYDAWLGVFKSFDGGESWDHDLLPPWEGVLTGSPEDTSHPLFGFDAAADPTIRAGLDGWFYYSGIAFDRVENGDSVIFVCRYKDTGSDIVYHDTKIIDTGTSGQFSDKPWSAVDIPSQAYPDGIVYIVYSIFLGQIDPNSNIHSKILVSRSIDGGETWQKPIKVSEGEQKNQGTVVAVDPIDGTVYVAWRRFASGNVPHGILIAKSEDFGQKFTKAVEIATPLRPFDQNTIKGGVGMAAQFRTYAFPAMAVDHSGTVHVAWSQRDVDLLDFADDARVVIASQAKEAWAPFWDYNPVESPVKIYHPGEEDYIPIHSHQFMPSLTYGAGKLMISWYDSRYSFRVFDEYGYMRDFNPNCPFGESTIEDPADRIIDGADTCEYRETIDVRAAQATPSASPDFGESLQVSRYIWVLEVDEETEDYKPRQGQFNPPNYKLFSAGTAPFHGDYLDIVSAPQFIKDNNVWRFSKDGDPLVYYVSWTDNRDVLPPVDDLWELYTKPDSGTCGSGMRNQNIYVSKLAPGIEVGVLGEFTNADNKQVFVIYINNKTSPFEDLGYNKFQLQIDPDQAASFFPGVPPSGTDDERTIVLNVPDHSSISRMVFVTSATYPIEIQISEIEPGDFTDSVFLKPGISPSISGGTSITKYKHDFINWIDPPYNPEYELANPNILTPNILTPNILTPNILTPNILTHNIVSPNILTPNILTPNILTPNILTPNILTPNILTTSMSILNPNILTPNILTHSLYSDIEVVDKIWTVKNNTGAVSSYTFKSIAGDSLPAVIDYYQLLIFKAHITPDTDGCALKDQVKHELLVNITNPNLIDATNLTPGQIKNITGDPLIEIENATFSLGPGEEGIVILRVMDNHPSSSPTSAGSMTSSMAAQTPPTEPTEAESFASNVGGLAVTHTSTEDEPVGATALMILPDTLLPGKAGESYPGATIRAIGGTGPYSWALIDGSLPEGLTWATFNDLIDDPDFGNMFVISSGMPKEAGTFAFTVEVTDANLVTDTQGFSISIADPEPLIITMDPVLPPSATKNWAYSGLTFTATGGVPSSGGGQLYSWTLNNAPPGQFGLQLPSNGDGGDVMELVGTPSEAGNFTVIVKVDDDFIEGSALDPESHPRPVAHTFDLCVRPAEPFDMIPLHADIPITCQPDQENPSNPPICPLPAGELGADYAEHNVILATQNHEGSLTWEVEVTDGNLPPGLDFFPSLSDGPVTGPVSLAIQGFPTYDGDLNYPKSYTVTVLVTEIYDFDGGCAGSRSAEKTLTITVNPKGKEWAVQESDLDGEAKDIAVDESGNVYVTGYINHATEGKNYYTRKYLANGSQDWQAFYNGPGNGKDIPSAIAVFKDPSSGRVYVYVTGTSDGGAKTSGPDIYTVAYDPSLPAPNDVIWEARYDGPSHLGDGANAMTVDTTGNVYVVGFVHRGRQKKHADYCTLKYDSKSGELLWDETYDSRRNGKDNATAIAVDSSGNVYVTGKSQESLTKAETTYDYLTLKYNSTGSLQYEVRDDGPGFGDDEPTAIIVDEAGNNVYVTGLTTGGTHGADYYTVKYDAKLNPLWETPGETYNGPGNGEDVPSAIAIDSLGYVYVTGKSLRVVNGDDFDFATVKYDKDGNPVWNTSDDGAVRFDGGGGNDEAIAVAVDDLGIYVAGFITTSTTGADYFVINYGEAGDIIWIARYPLPGDLPQGDEFATAMTIDATGVYVTGYSKQGETSRYATVKFNK